MCLRDCTAVTVLMTANVCCASESDGNRMWDPGCECLLSSGSWGVTLCIQVPGGKQRADLSLGFFQLIDSMN